MCLFTNPSKKRREGAVLLIVLGVILLASWMLVQILARVGEEVSVRGEDEQNDALKTSAFQALEITMGVLAEIKLLDDGLYSPVQGWGNPLGYAGFPSHAASNELEFAAQESGDIEEIVPFAFPPGIQVTVELRDESGRFPLNTTSGERWKLLFEEMEIQSSDAATLTDCLLDWIDADDETRLNGAEKGTYQRRDPAYLPANAPIVNTMDLQLIEGFDRLFFDEDGLPNDLYRTFLDCITVLNFEGVNLNAAHPLVLAVLGEERDFEPERIADYIAGTDLEPGTLDDNVLRPGLDDPDLPTNNEGEALDLSTTSRFITVYITAMSAGTVFNLSARLDTETPSEHHIYPMTILDLQTKGSTL
ncbi:type II secretion system protein GspK [Pontiellaceae bacterium B12219]|nr:type II secretion system protein GspK [Pontiellaceae bacterium B12219]